MEERLWATISKYIHLRCTSWLEDQLEYPDRSNNVLGNYDAFKLVALSYSEKVKYNFLICPINGGLSNDLTVMCHYFHRDLPAKFRDRRRRPRCALQVEVRMRRAGFRPWRASRPVLALAYASGRARA